MKILIIKLGAKGDVLRTLSLLPAIKNKFPDSEIHWVTKTASLELLKDIPYINKLYSLPFSTDEHFNVLYNFDIEKEATDIAENTKADKKYGFYLDQEYPAAFNLGASYYLETIFDDFLKKENKKTYQQMMFDVADLKYNGEHCPIFLDERDKEYAKEFIRQNNLNKNNLIGIHVGSSKRWPSRSWPTDMVEDFIEKIKNKDYDVVLFAGPDEKDKQERIIQNLALKGIRVLGNDPQNTDKQFASLIDSCRTIVCSDSYSQHVSLALKKPTITLFFCTSPNEIEGYGFLKKIISPMLYDFFPEKMDKYSEELMKSIPVERVVNSLEEIRSVGERRVVNAIIKHPTEERFLVIKRKKTEEIHPGKWAFPGGLVEKGESFEKALEREIKEEVGLTLNKIIKKISCFSYVDFKGQETKGECYFVEVIEDKVKINQEVESFKWAGLEELNKLDCIEGLDEEAIKTFL